ncbi:hypothetical protein STSP2_01417 [Anaerohalosphaera lusitana]|uniref:Immunity MXAN-0049 protein domain-containing protein n=1 Tax=Anaerohalosphaera lusitana TaxID=1936003 RepID=A0A1U9NK09_9BACT|nr:DUF1629 domain-containing protein [Anaerohalosphaera lusitana]AQT68261.1 hypothetical protein STSP2_01417 [Anaerohalosphaera lusitana]
MKNFYSISHNSFDTRGFPWGEEVLTEIPKRECLRCGGIRFTLEADIDLLLERCKGSKWPDVLGLGMSYFTVSGRVLEDWKREGIGEFPVHRVRIAKPYPKKLEDTAPPNYHWIDGRKMVGAKLDYEASGFVNHKFCDTCGRLLYDDSGTYKKRFQEYCPYVFVPGSWEGADLFTTDYSHLAFFCTEKVLDCARKHQHTNFRFTPIEEGIATNSKGVQYMKRKR